LRDRYFAFSHWIRDEERRGGWLARQARVKESTNLLWLSVQISALSHLGHFDWRAANGIKQPDIGEI
jgi:hypothetical protein